MKCTKVTISPDKALELIEEYKNELLNKDVPLRLHHIGVLQTLKLISEGTEMYVIDQGTRFNRLVRKKRK